MTKSHKQQIEELVRKLEKVHEQIKTCIGQGRYQDTMTLLESCQNAGIVIGTEIEESEGEGHQAVSLLEEYCELVYQIHSDLAEHKEINGNKAYKLLNQKLVKAGNILRNEIPVKTEAVFLPYKASMWDSLESVWRAAKADPDCNVYVVPIPYYDKNPDGSFGEMHYEGDQYPEYVPVIRYDTYDLETRRPDVIFIHNPYDDCNYVTCVDPRFYSKNLINFTGKLVYIPYFTLGEKMYKSLCVAPGTLLPNVVIAHSASAREDYIKYLKEFYMENTNMQDKEAEKMLRERILPLGSPKIDKVINGKREDYVLPEEWKKRLEGRKAVLYNTGISGILNGNEQELRKIWDTITYFSKRDDVILWWRPHPLTGATVQSMRSHLLETYLTMVEQYKKSRIGIYDDTPDLHRALLWTDMYYGDDSSLIYLYGVQGKPVVMQNIYCLTEEDKERTDTDRRIFEGQTYRIGEGSEYTLARICDALVNINRENTEMKRYYRSLYANSDGTAGSHIWEEVKPC